MAAHPQLFPPHVNERLAGMPAEGLMDFHVVTGHPQLDERLVHAHELQMNHIAAGGFADQAGAGVPDRRQLFVEPSFHRTACNLLNRPAGFTAEQELEHYIVVLSHLSLSSFLN